jgi:TonB-dependent receptor
MIVSATHSHGYDHTESNRKIYTIRAGDELRLQNDYDFDTDEESVRRGLVGNFAYRVGANHKIELRSLYSDDSKAQSRYFEGYNDDQSTDVRNYRLRYQREEIGSYQLSGEHFLEGWGDGDLLEWRGSIGTATNAENIRENLYKYENNDFILTDESQSAFMLYNDLEDDLADGGLDWTHFITGDEVYGNLQVGAAVATRDRSFASRRFRFNFRDTTSMDLTLTPDELFVADNISSDGFEIKEETRPTDTYEASHDVTAGYVMTDLTFGRWRFVGGVRYEDSAIEVTTFDPFNLDADPILSTVEDDELMPALSATYRLGDRSNLRGAFSRTVNRPEFRELAPFEFTDVVGGRSARGNPELGSAVISSFDVRYEWFPDTFGVVAASLFYKDFTDPIERTLESSVELVSTWRNVDSASNYGAELEFRRDLGFLAEALAPFMVQLNYTYVKSEINVGEDDVVVTNPTRPLVGQPDHVYNVVLEWQQPSWGTTTRLLYTSTGEKVAEAGGFGIPDVIEEPWSSLDFAWRQDLGFSAKGLGAKLSLTNLLDDEVEFSGGVSETYKRGRGVGLSLSYTPF